jgi:nitrate reductase gamma subunit
MDLYLLTRGPFAWAAFLIFFYGCLYQIVFILAMGHRKKILYPWDGIKGSLRSFVFGLLPFASSYMRKNPVLTLVTAIFHICVFLVPLFLLAHIVLWYESWELLWWSLPESFADVMSISVIFSCIFFLGRRFFVPEVKNATKTGDILLLILVMTPFLTGFLATHQWGPYRPILIAHIISSEILLSAIPFTRLGHMFFFWVSRAYMGAEYSKIMHTGDW